MCANINTPMGGETGTAHPGGTPPAGSDFPPLALAYTV